MPESRSIESLRTQLLGEDPFLQRIAGPLVFDPTGAEDLIQETYLNALKRPPTRGGNLRGWLKTVLRRRATADSLSGARRRERERIAAKRERDPSPASEVQAEREEIRRELIDSVLALDESSRRVILFRFYRDLSCAEIAEQEGCAVKTIESRLRRALEKLRHSLDAKHDEPLAWPKRLIPWLTLPFPGTQPKAPASLGAGGSGVLSLGKAALWLVPAVTVVAFAWAFWFDRDSTGPEDGLSDSAKSDVIASSAALEARRSQGSEAPVTAGPAISSDDGSDDFNPAPRGTGQVIVTCRDHIGRPYPGLHLVLRRPDIANSTLREERVVSDARGVAVFSNLDPGRCWLFAIRGGSESFGLRAGEKRKVEFQVPRGADLDLLVKDHEGRAVAGAEIWCSTGNHPDEGGVLARTDARGYAQVRDLSGYFVAARKAGHAPSVRYRVPKAIGKRTQLDLTLTGQGGSLKGRVVDEQDHAIPGAWVQVGVGDRRERKMPDGSVGQPPPGVRVVTDKAGRFEASGLLGGIHHVFVRAPGFVIIREAVEVPIAKPESAESRVFRLAKAASVSALVVDDEGEPQADVLVSNQKRESLLRIEAMSDPNGRVRLPNLSSGGAAFWATAGARGQAVGVLNASGSPTQKLILRKGQAVFGKVVGEGGVGVPGAVVSVFEQDPDLRHFERVVTDAEGNFMATNRRAVPHVVAIYENKKADYPSRRIENIQPGAGFLRLKFDAASRDSAELFGRIVDEQGRAIGKASFWLSAAHIDIASGHEVDRRTGAFRIGPLMKTDYLLSFRAEGYGETRFGPFLVDGKKSLGVGNLIMRRPGKLVAKLGRIGGGAVGVPRGLLVDEHRFARPFRVVDDVLTCEDLPPGIYELQLYGPGLKDLERDVVIKSGETTRLTLHFESR